MIPVGIATTSAATVAPSNAATQRRAGQSRIVTVVIPLPVSGYHPTIYYE